MLLHGARQVRLFGETVEVNAKILNLPGISGHADREQLTKWAGAFAQHAPKKFFIVHGEDAQTDAFAAHLHQEFGYEAAAPYSGDVYDLMTGLRIKQGLGKFADQINALCSAFLRPMYLQGFWLPENGCLQSFTK